MAEIFVDSMVSEVWVEVVMSILFTMVLNWAVVVLSQTIIQSWLVMGHRGPVVCIRVVQEALIMLPRSLIED